MPSNPMQVFIAGPADRLAEALAQFGLRLARLENARFLINADPAPDAEVVVARCRDFADMVPDGEDALIVTILRKPPAGLDAWRAHAAAASLWAFTRQAALAWAPRNIRVNAIGLGTSPLTPWEPIEQSGRAAAAIPAAPASVADLARTLAALAKFRSMTGQIIRLGA